MRRSRSVEGVLLASDGRSGGGSMRGQAVEVPTPIALLAGRENPETHEGYQVCLRCTAYRD